MQIVRVEHVAIRRFDGHEIVVVPEDPVIARADEQGCAPIDVDPRAPGVKALLGLAERLGRHPS